jgi:NAD(P)-dependent dehydrogenase (short-subunit alcohol dehydrogenase family)
MELKKKNILITGAGKGIGESCLKNFIENGAYVYAIIKVAKDNYKFKNLKNISIINGNVSNTKLIQGVIQKSIKDKKKINCVVNNAGIRHRKDFINISDKELTKVFEVNFFSIFRILQLISKFWVKNNIEGNVVNITSIVGQIGFKQLSAYASSKGALVSLTKSFALEFSDFGIRANSLSPGFTKTSFYDEFKKNKTLYNWTLSRIPQKRWGSSHEISEMVSFLLSDRCKYINGENINIDGGWLNS